MEMFYKSETVDDDWVNFINDFSSSYSDAILYYFFNFDVEWPSFSNLINY